MDRCCRSVCATAEAAAAVVVADADSAAAKLAPVSVSECASVCRAVYVIAIKGQHSSAAASATLFGAKVESSDSHCLCRLGFHLPVKVNVPAAAAAATRDDTQAQHRQRCKTTAVVLNLLE